MDKPLILCDCSGTFSIDADRLSTATNRTCSKVHTALCGDEIELAAQHLAQGDATICCTQESRVFTELAAEIESAEPLFLDLRDRAGWSADSGDALPKMSALVAESALTVPAMKTLDVHSHGLCLIIGPSETALPAAERLKDTLGVTVLLTDMADAPLHRDFDVIRGQLHQAKGALGQFVVRIDALSQLDITGRSWEWTAPRDGGQSECDIILDLTGGTPLFPAPEKREGYLRPDPKSPQAVADAILTASQLIGTFEKPLYIRNEPLLCAHSRASQDGCSRCLDVCPTGAIISDGEHVSIDPMVCAGCGSCASLCPSGALTYDAPPTDSLFVRIQTLAKSYLAAGGQNPRLLVVNTHGTEMIQMSARFGRGLPVDVIPMEVEALNSFGHAEILAALAAGFAKVDILLSPKVERDVQLYELELAQAIAGEAKAAILDFADPDALSDALFDADVPAALDTPIRPIGTRRQITRQAAKALQPDTQSLPLPEKAPYGAVLVDTDACSLCLSCVSLCPSGALLDNEDKPQLRFQEDACLQCGLCATACPEDAIAYEPRLNLAPAALSQEILNEEEPFECVECGTPFGVKSTIEKVMAKLAGNHAMFANPAAARMIQMCDNCRVAAQYHQHSAPMAGAPRPKVRTSDDYFSKRRDH